LELVKRVYLEYWGTKFKGVEQPNESDRNVALYADGGKKGDGKKQNYKKFKGNCNYCGIQGNKLADCCKHKAAEKNDPWKSRMRMVMTARSAGDVRKKGISQETVQTKTKIEEMLSSSECP